ncbi:MAG: hypothetical protein ACOC23_08810 [Thermodesulfobacteriota bacterium]
MSNYCRNTETAIPTEGVTARLVTEVIDGEELDTFIQIEGRFTIAGKTRHRFLKALGELIDHHRI